MGLAQAHPPIDEQRIVGLGQLLADCHARGVRKLVAGPDHEGVEGVSRVELGARFPGPARRPTLVGLLGSLVGGGGIFVWQDQLDFDLVEEQVLQRRPQQPQVVIFEPFLEETIWKKDLQAILFKLSQRQRAEPGLEALAADPTADDRERFFPDFLHVQRRRSVHVLTSKRLIHNPSNG